MWLQKLKEYLEGSNLIAKLQAKHDMLKRSIAEGDVTSYSKCVIITIIFIIYCCIRLLLLRMENNNNEYLH